MDNKHLLNSSMINFSGIPSAPILCKWCGERMDIDFDSDGTMYTCNCEQAKKELEINNKILDLKEELRNLKPTAPALKAEYEVRVKELQYKFGMK